jgi:hypothetical protein
MQIGISLALTRLARGGFSPATLFAMGEQGYWLDPSDFSTMFQDSAGTTPVTAVGQNVGLMLDKSRGGIGSNGAFRRNLLTRTEEFNDAAWVKSESTVTANADTAPDGTLTADNATPTGATPIVRQTHTTSIAGAYTGTIWLRSATNTNVTISLRPTGAGSPLSVVCAVTPIWQRFSINFTAVAGVTNIQFWVEQFSQAILIWGAQLELGSTATPYQRITSSWEATIPGNHFIQSSLASRPVLGRNPITGTRNLLTRTEEFNDAVWGKNDVTITADAEVAPDNTSTADRMVANTANAQHRVIQTITLTVQSYTYSVFAKADGYNWLAIFSNHANTGRHFDLQNGVVGSQTGNPNTATIVALGNGWYRCSMTFTGVAVSAALTINVANANSTFTFTGDGTSGILIWGAQLELGSTATAYQRVGGSFDVTEAGVPDAYYLSYDGSDDFLVSAATINPGAVDKAQVFAGVRKLSDVALGALVESSANSSSSDGALNIFAPAVSSTSSYGAGSRGTINRFIQASGFLAPISNVVSNISDISGDSLILRVNGTQVASSTADQGTGNYLSYLHYIGRRGGTSVPFNGRIYQMITRFGPNLTSDVITQSEAFVAQRTGFTAPDIQGVPTIS